MTATIMFEDLINFNVSDVGLFLENRVCMCVF